MLPRAGLMSLCLLAPTVPAESTDGPLLAWQYEGSAVQGARFVKVMEDPRAQELLLAVAAEPREMAFVASALKEAAVKAVDLEPRMKAAGLRPRC